MRENYVFPSTIKSLVLTHTKHHITSKNMVVLTNENSLYLIEHQFYSARRPKAQKINPEDVKRSLTDEVEEEDPNKPPSLKEKELPPYEGILQLKETNFLTYGTSLNNLQMLKSFSTNLESTSQVLAFGHDLFFIRLAPEKTYDRLTDQINVLYIALAIVAGLVVYTLSHGYIDSKKRKQKFLMS